MNILCQSNDGFFIANEDLRLRGPGDFFGVRQSGDFEFRLGDIMNDSNTLKKASDAVNEISAGKIELSEDALKALNQYNQNQINI